MLDGDQFVVNGQKVWTSGANHADWCFCFVRTDPDAPEAQGHQRRCIIDMDTPGHRPAPVPRARPTRDHPDFNEVFFTDVRVPAENLVGELNGGWAITQGSLAHERACCGSARVLPARSARWPACWSSSAERLAELPEVEQGADRRSWSLALYIDAQAPAHWATGASPSSWTGRHRPEHSLLKLFGSESCSSVALVGAEALGSTASTSAESRPARCGARARGLEQYLRSFGGTIPGGTTEIQRNIIAERVLGLPRG